MTTREPGESPDDYRPGLATVGDPERCEECDQPVEVEPFEVPCCGGEYDCTDSNTLRMCHRCRTVSYDW